MVLIWLHKASRLISTIKNQSNHIETILEEEWADSLAEQRITTCYQRIVNCL